MFGPSGQEVAIAYIGTVGPPRGMGNYIYVFKLESIVNWQIIQVVKDNPNPITLLLNSQLNRLYCCNAPSFFPWEYGCLSAYDINNVSGEIRLFSTISSEAAHPSHMALDIYEQHIVYANYYGKVGVAKLNSAGGFEKTTDLWDIRGTSENFKKLATHPLQITFAPTSFKRESFFVVDQGLDRVVHFQYDPFEGIISHHLEGSYLMPEQGSRPRQMVTTTVYDTKYIYVVNEATSTVCFFHYAPVDDQKPVQTISTLPDNYEGPPNQVAAIVLHPNETFMYVANRGMDTIAVISINSRGRLTLLKQEMALGQKPVFLRVFEKYLMVCNELEHNVITFSLEEGGSCLVPIYRVQNVYSPTCIVLKLHPRYKYC